MVLAMTNKAPPKAAKDSSDQEDDNEADISAEPEAEGKRQFGSSAVVTPGACGTGKEFADPNLHQKKKKQRVRKRRKIKTVVPATSLDAKKTENRTDIDPVLIKLTALGHDFNNVKSLFLSNLHSTANAELVLDSARIDEEIADIEGDAPLEAGDELDEVVGILEGVLLNEDAKICPNLANFKFSDRKSGKTLRLCSTHESNQLDMLQAPVLSFHVRTVTTRRWLAARASSRSTSTLRKWMRNCRRRKLTFSKASVIWTPSTRPKTVRNPVLNPSSDSCETFAFLSELNEDEILEGVSRLDKQNGDSDAEGGGGSDAKRDKVTRQSIIRALNLESLPDLQRILSDKPDDYTYFDRQVNTAAGCSALLAGSAPLPLKRLS